jgi:magnesium transporter
MKDKVTKDIPLSQIKKILRNKKITVWVDLQKATGKEFKQIEETFNFHPLSMEDARKSIELPKVDNFDDYIFVVLHSISREFKEGYPVKREIDFFLGKNFLVTVHNHSATSMEHLVEILGKNNNRGIKAPDLLMYEIVDFFVDSYFPLLDYWDDRIEALETSIVAQKQLHNVLKDILYIKREILYLKKSIAPERDVINKLSRRDFPFIHPLTSIYFRDVYDHIMRIYAELEMQRDLLSGAFEAYTSVLSNRLNVISNRLNTIMQKLTVIATIFMPLTFIAGVYGMNFHYFPEITWRYGYYLFWAVCIIIGIFMYWFFKKKRWTKIHP